MLTKSVMEVKTGFRTEGQPPARKVSFIDQSIERLKALPGVQAADFASSRFSGGSRPPRPSRVCTSRGV